MIGRIILGLTDADYVTQVGTSEPVASSKNEIWYETDSNDNIVDSVYIANESLNWIQIQ